MMRSSNVPYFRTQWHMGLMVLKYLYISHKKLNSCRIAVALKYS